MAKMIDPDTIYIGDFSSTVIPPETPFERPGPTTAGHRFIYLTNRRQKRFSLLLDPRTGHPIVDEAYGRIQQGYTQLWLFEKRYAAHARRGRRRRTPRDVTLPKAATDYPAVIERGEWAGRLYVVLREPVLSPAASPYDTLTYHADEAEAIAAADRYANEAGWRAVVGLMWEDLQWH